MKDYIFKKDGDEKFRVRAESLQSARILFIRDGASESDLDECEWEKVDILYATDERVTELERKIDFLMGQTSGYEGMCSTKTMKDLYEQQLNK